MGKHSRTKSQPHPLSLNVFNSQNENTSKNNSTASYTISYSSLHDASQQSSGSVIGSSRELVRSLRKIKSSEIPPEVPNIEFIQKIGKGASGDVWEGLDKRYGIHVAIKVMICDYFERRILPGILKEITVPVFCTHHNIDGHMRIEISELYYEPISSSLSSSKKNSTGKRSREDDNNNNNNNKRKRQKTEHKQHSPSNESSTKQLSGLLPSALQVAIIMPLMVMNLRTFMEAWKSYTTQCKLDGTFNPEEEYVITRFILKEIIEGLWLVHHNGLLHLDIKPENILVSPDGNIGLFDFGLSKYKCSEYTDEDYHWYYHHHHHHRNDNKNMEDPVKKNNMKYNWIKTVRHEELVTAPYRSPETFCRAMNVGPHVDIWSFACIMAELFIGTHPFFPGKERVSKNDCFGYIIGNMMSVLGPPEGSIEAYRKLGGLMEKKRFYLSPAGLEEHKKDLLTTQEQIKTIYETPLPFLPTRIPVNEYKNCKQFNVACMNTLSKGVELKPIKEQVKQTHGAIAWDLLEHILVWDYTKRFDLEQILSHRYFSYSGDYNSFTPKDFMRFISETLSKYIPNDQISSSYKRLRIDRTPQKVYYGITSCVGMATEPLYGDDSEISNFRDITSDSDSNYKKSISSVCNVPDGPGEGIFQHKAGCFRLEMSLSSTV